MSTTPIVIIGAALVVTALVVWGRRFERRAYRETCTILGINPEPDPMEEIAADYWATNRHLLIASIALSKATDPAERARLLLKLADGEQRLADTHTDVFGPDPLNDPEHEDENSDQGICTDLAESLAFSAMLYRLLADVEQAVAFPNLGRRNTDTRLEDASGDILGRMVETPNLDNRMRMLSDLIEAVSPIVGGQAAESLWCLPAPGFSGPLPLAEKDEWLAGYGEGRNVITRVRRMDVIAPRILLAAVVVATLLGVGWSIGGYVRGSWPAAAFGAALAFAVPVLHVRRRLARRSYLAAPTVYDYEVAGLPVE